MEFADLIVAPNVDNVVFHGPFNTSVEATMCITGHHLILSPHKEQYQELWLIHEGIDALEKKVNSSGSHGPNGGSITLKYKDFRIVQIDFGNIEDYTNVSISLERLSNIENVKLSYPFFYRPMYTILEDGYTLFQPEIEFAKLLASEEWRISHVNKDYSVCPTYASSLVVPKKIDDDTLIAAASFRDGGRFPLLSYRHDNGAILMRSSQPLLNNSNKRSRHDEEILKQIIIVKKGYIVDTRSANYANQCKSKGGGTEPEGHYSHWKRIHKGLDKISHCNGALLESLTKLIDAVNDTHCSHDKWLSRLENSNWLTHVQNALDAACLVAQFLDQDGVPVLVHGSNGTDSTLLVTSIAQVILNPDCRTVRGLQALIEREWIQGGFPFHMRHRKSCYSATKNKQNQPTFLLFLDCLHQLHYQFPCSFEFITQFLIQIFEHSYSSQFGTFLGNSEAERNKFGVHTQTTSLWSYLNRPEILTAFLNPMYEPNKAPIWPSVASVSIVLWEDLFFRWIIDQNEAKKAFEKIKSIVADDKSLRSVALKMRKELLDLHKEVRVIQEFIKDEIGIGKGISEENQSITKTSPEEALHSKEILKEEFNKECTSLDLQPSQYVK
ncbi:myotubularin-related protein 9 [Agrilus planipennis]|uniref:Myotubularin-related protein 9 n=1 Tax=Agrilus planipennis TaxID=224129 RepID=A0A1W4XKZ4_AGRPL|nr:myotubularin-related protein 9 [Agrilus planipennis]